MKTNSRKHPLREADALEFVVRVDLKGQDGITYDVESYLDDETDIDFENGIYGYDEDIREHVNPMTRDTATKLAADIIEQAPAGDVLVGVVPYSTIPNEGEPGVPGTEDDMGEGDDGSFEDEEAAPDEFDDSDFESEEEPEEDEGEEEPEEEEEPMDEAIIRARKALRTIQERSLSRNRRANRR